MRRPRLPRRRRNPGAVPKPEFEDNEGFWEGLSSIHECNESTDLFILPITAAMLWRYLTSVLVGAVEEKGLIAKVAGVSYFREGLKSLQAAGVNSPWGKGIDPPSFGIYSTVLGQVGTPRAAQSSFGGKHNLYGVQSLLDLYMKWKSSTPAHPPSFYAVQGVRMAIDGSVVGSGSGSYQSAKPIAVVVTGKSDDIEGFGIGIQDPGRGVHRGQKLDQSSVLAAALWALPDRGAQNLCIILPRPVWLKPGAGFDGMTAAQLRRWGREELTQQRAYQGFLSEMNKSEWLYGMISRGVRTDLVNAMLSPKGAPMRGDGLRDALSKRSAVIEEGLTIRQVQPPVSWNRFFGSLPPFQFWAARFISYVSAAEKRGDTPNKMKEAVEGAAADYASWTRVQSSLPKFGKDFRDHLKALESITRGPGTKTAASTKLRIGDLTPSITGETLFIEDIREGPTQGLYVPARVTIRSRGQQQSRDLVPPDVLAEYVKEYKTGKADLYPMIRAKVFLIDKPTTLKRPPLVGEEERPASASEISNLLKAQARVVSRGKRDTWYMGFPSAEILVPTKMGEKIVLVPNPSGQVYMAGKHNIREVARDLLRVQLAYNRNEPTLKFVLGTPSRLWTSNGSPYLFSKLPLYDRERQQTSMWSPGQKTPSGVDGYYQAVKNAFARSRPSRTVIGGQYSLSEGAEEIGGMARGRSRPKSQRVASKMAYQLGGFYSLARQVIDQQGVRKVQDRKGAAGRSMLYDVIDRNWKLILHNLNQERAEEGEPPIPLDTPPPTDPEHPNVDLERQVLLTLDLLLKPIPEDVDFEDIEEDVPSNYQILSRSSIMRPAAVMPVMEEGGSVFEDEVSSFVKSIRNPLRKKGGDPLSPQSFIESMEVLFPRKATTATLKEAPARLEVLEGEYEFGEKTDPSERLGEEGSIWGDLWGESEAPLSEVEPDEEKAEQSLLHIQKRSRLTREEAEAIEKARLESRSRRSTLSASGALCQMYRNAVRLRTYRPPPAVLARGTAWVVLHKEENGSQRIMSFRNGAHVDCDMVVTERRSLGFLLGKAVESMVIWMAGKEIRTRRIKGIYATSTGSRFYRILWTTGKTLDTDLMLRSAYAGVATPMGSSGGHSSAEPPPLG